MIANQNDGLKLDGVTLSVSGRDFLGPVNIEIAKGEIVTVMGPSGSGKSSLLDFICGTLSGAFVASGSIVLNGQQVGGLPVEDRRIGMLFQDDLLFPHMTVAENLLFGVPEHIKSRKDRRARMAAALDDADMAGYEDRRPATLSGGQRARIALMRVLLSEPAALLLDEPFGTLDQSLRAQIRAFVFDHARRQALPTLLVTHDTEDADAAGGRVITLSGSA